MADDILVIRPTEIDDVLVNPGMGWTSANRFDNPEKTDVPRSSLAYYKFGWIQVEPTPGEYDWHLIDELLALAPKYFITAPWLIKLEIAPAIKKAGTRQKITCNRAYSWII